MVSAGLRDLLLSVIVLAAMLPLALAGVIPGDVASGIIWGVLGISTGRTIERKAGGGG